MTSAQVAVCLDLPSAAHHSQYCPTGTAQPAAAGGGECGGAVQQHLLPMYSGVPGDFAAAG